MKINHIKSSANLWVYSLLLLLTCLTACKREPLTLSTTGDVNITGYFQKFPDEFSLFSQILVRSGTASYLGAYGNYTIFAPTNDAIKAYLLKIGKSSVDQIDAAAAKDIVRMHLIEDTVSTTSFKDGKLAQLTMYGQYLVTGTSNVNGVTKYLINRQATLLQGNIRVGNGIIHVIDHVLEPAKFTLAQTIEQNPKFSIFSQALKATGFYDTLNVLPAANTNPNRKFLTLLAESDSVLSLAGINSYAALKQKYSTTVNPQSHQDSLWLFVAYHILPDARYLTDIISAASHPTLAPLEVLTSKLQVQTVLINDDVFNGVLEPGIELLRPTSDLTASNGVIHNTSRDFKIKVRLPFRVDFDFGDQPEIRAQTSVFRKASKTTPIPINTWKYITFQNPTASVGSSYTVEPVTSTNYYWWDDYVTIPMTDGTFNTAARHKWVEFTTPLIVRGKYKVWLDWRIGGTGMRVQGSVDGTILPNIVLFSSGFTTSLSDNELEAQGYKRYSQAANSISSQPGKLLGVIDIPTTDRHKFRIEDLVGNGNFTIDMVQFIPIDADQQYPRFARNGSLIPRP